MYRENNGRSLVVKFFVRCYCFIIEGEKIFLYIVYIVDLCRNFFREIRFLGGGCNMFFFFALFCSIYLFYLVR